MKINNNDKLLINALQEIINKREDIILKFFFNQGKKKIQAFYNSLSDENKRLINEVLETKNNDSIRK